MKTFERLSLDWSDCAKEVEEFQQLLDANKSLDERRDLLPFFRTRPNLCGLCGALNPGIAMPDRVAWEYDLFGDFSCDFVVGDSIKMEYCFVELEDANEKSIFELKPGKATSEWSKRFEHGYSQVVDWFYKLNDLHASTDFACRFGAKDITYDGWLVIGRDQYLDRGESSRLSWRKDHVIVNSKKIICLTYDQLAQRLLSKLTAVDTIRSAASKLAR